MPGRDIACWLWRPYICYVLCFQYQKLKITKATNSIPNHNHCLASTPSKTIPSSLANTTGCPGENHYIIVEFFSWLIPLNCLYIKRWIISIPFWPRSIKGIRIRLVESCPPFNALDEIRIGKKIPSECDKICQVIQRF